MGQPRVGDRQPQWPVHGSTCRRLATVLAARRQCRGKEIRASQANKYATDEVFREKAKQRAAERYAKNREQILARLRAKTAKRQNNKKDNRKK